MKKFILVPILIAMSLYLYYRFTVKDDANDAERAPGNPAIESNDRADSGSFGVTEKDDRNDNETLQENSVRFSVVFKGESNVYTYKAVNNFSKVSLSHGLSGYVASFAENIGKINIRDQSTYGNVISIMLPSDAAPGDYNEKSDNVIFQYFGTKKGVIYNPDPAGSFAITVNEWGGSGARAKGTFSGRLKSEESSDPILIQEGMFDIGIQ